MHVDDLWMYVIYSPVSTQLWHFFLMHKTREAFAVTIEKACKKFEAAREPKRAQTIQNFNHTWHALFIHTCRTRHKLFALQAKKGRQEQTTHTNESPRQLLVLRTAPQSQVPDYTLAIHPHTNKNESKVERGGRARERERERQRETKKRKEGK